MADFNSPDPTPEDRKMKRVDVTSFNDAEERLEDTELEAIEQAEAEAFDLAGWLSGIGAAEAVYPLAGQAIRMQSRTPEWQSDFAAKHKDLDSDVRDRLFLAAHIVDEAVTADTLRSLQKNRPADFYDMANLAIQIDSRPSNQIAPRFLPTASA